MTAVDFQLKPPLPKNVFEDRHEKTIEALASSVIDDFSHALVERAEILSGTVESRRDETGQLMDSNSAPQGIYINMQSVGIAYLAYCMGDAMPLEIHREDGADESIEQGDGKGKKAFVLGWIKHLEQQYGGDVAHAMMHHVTHEVDAALYEYFPQMKTAEPSAYEAHLNAQEPPIGSPARREFVQRVAEKKSFGKHELN